MDATRPRRRKPSMPQALRKEVVEHCRTLTRKYCAAFKIDRELKARVLTLTRALLPPRPKPRGRPANPQTTRALALYRKFRRKFPQERHRATWSRVYPLVIPAYGDMSDMDQRAARHELRERVSWRRRRKPREIAAHLNV